MAPAPVIEGRIVWPCGHWREPHVDFQRDWDHECLDCGGPGPARWVPDPSGTIPASPRHSAEGLDF